MSKKQNALAIFSRGAQMLAEATTIQASKELKDLGITAKEWARRKGMGEEALTQAHAFAFDAECQMGRLLKKSERAKPPSGKGQRRRDRRCHAVTDGPPTLEDLGITKKESSAAQKADSLPKRIKDKVRDRQMTRAAAQRKTSQVKFKANLENTKAKTVKAAAGVYDVVVIDPPWPMKKIERDCRPNQVAMDYPTMDEQELGELKVPAAKDAHIWLWTTHRFLPMALGLLEAWKLKYVCVFVWHKPGGFQPVGLPQYPGNSWWPGK